MLESRDDLITYINSPEFIQKFDHDIKQIRQLIHVQDKALLQPLLNRIIDFCLANIANVQNKNSQIHLYLEIFKTLSLYGEVYKSTQTFENIMKLTETVGVKQLLFSNRPVETCLTYGESLLRYYGLQIEISHGQFKKEEFLNLLKAKYYLLKAYNQSVEGINRLGSEDFSYCLVLLSVCFVRLQRWFEPLFYLKQLRNEDDPNYHYILARNLDELKERTCLNYNGILILKIIESSEKTLQNDKVDPRSKHDVKEILDRCYDDLTKAKLSVDQLKKHNRKIIDSRPRRNRYFTYCADNQFFLNEHSFFCKCGASIGDNLEIKTAHPHTQIDWVLKFETLLDVISADYTTARFNLYESEVSKPASTYKYRTYKGSFVRNQKDAHLKNAFKICYSILDQICYGIFEAFAIDIEATLKAKGENRKVYFLNMWDLYAFSEKAFRENLYLLSLYSIAEDLGRSEYAALKGFKEIRNAMEHKTLLLVDDQKPDNNKFQFNPVLRLSRPLLLAKTELLLILTKSAILSFT